MSKKQKIMRFMISGTLLAAVALVGISVYQVDVSQQERMEELNELAEAAPEMTEEFIQGGNSTAGLDEVQPHHSVIEDEEEEIPETEDVTSGQVTAQLEDKDVETENNSNKEQNLSKQEETKKSESVEESIDQADEASTQASVIVPEVGFSGELLMNWPVEGTVLMDYSMDHSVYFETLNIYKYNPSVLFDAEVGTPVEAAANMKILQVEETLETGVTITADMGNGYQAVYGQLKDVTVKADDVVAAGTVLGYVSEPTKYYTKEGANLYFAMTKDGESIDPVLYLP